MNARVARMLFQLSRIAERTGFKQTPLGRGAARLMARLFLRGPSGLPPSTLRFRLDGLRLAFPRDCAFVYARPDFEQGLRRLLDDLLQPGMTVADVGANVGFLTALMARRVGPTGRVYAVEPAPSNVEILRHNLAANGLTHVEVLPFACGAAESRRTLFLRRHSTLHSLHAGSDEAPMEEIPIQERPLDDLVPEPVDLVKVDTEGAELDVLEGMHRLLGDSPEVHLILEWNVPGLRRAGRAPEELPAALRDRGFEVHCIDDHTGELLPVEPRVRSLQKGDLPPDYFTNLYATPSEAK